jgi:uncharacterized protein
MTTPPPPQTPDASPKMVELERLIKDNKLPPLDSWNPDYCGPSDMRIARDGTWFYRGTPISRPAMVKLFSSILRREADGRTYLVTPVEKLDIEIEDAPFVGVELISEGHGAARRIAFRLNTDDMVFVGPQHALWVENAQDTQAPNPYVHVRAGLNARLNRATFYELVELALAEQQPGAPVGLWSAGVFFPLEHPHEA